MSFDYFASITPFALQACDPWNPPQKRWKPEAFQVARSLLRFLDNPDAIDQSCFGLCGPVAFLRAWAYRDPVAVVNFATDLYKNGSAKIGDYEVRASDDLLHCPWMVLPPDPPLDWKDGQWGRGNRITESAWMIVGTLACTEDRTLEHATLGWHLPPLSVSEFDGFPASNLSTLTLPNELKRWLEHTNCYSGGIDDNTDVVVGKSLADDSAISSGFDDDVDVFLCIHSNMLSKATSVTPPFSTYIAKSDTIIDNFPNHWVMLTEKVTVNSDIVTMKIWTWGGYHTVTLSLHDFNDDYFGSVVAHALSKRRVLALSPLLDSAISNQRIYYSQDNSLHFRWHSGDPRTEWFELHRVGAKEVQIAVDTAGCVLTALPRDVLQRIWRQSGAQEYHVTLPMQDYADPHGTQYEIVACHAALKPYNCDPFSYNCYNSVQCNVELRSNVKAEYKYSGPIEPLCEMETVNYRLRYYGYPCSQQIPDGLDPSTTYTKPHDDKTIEFAGEVIGHCYSDGKIDIVRDNTLVAVGNEPRTPFYVQSMALWLEYLYQELNRTPLSLKNPGAGQKIVMTIGRRPQVVIDANHVAHIDMYAPVSDQEVPFTCLKALLSLLRVQSEGWPDKILPPFAAQVAVVQVPAPSVPDDFADFRNSFKPCERMTVYDAQWITKLADSRGLKSKVNSPLNTGRITYIFVKFSDKVSDEAIRLNLSGQTPDGATANIAIGLEPSADHSYYYGYFQPANEWARAYTLRLEIQAARAWRNSVLRALLGDLIDSAPATIAKVDESNPRRFGFLNYEPGVDRNHHIEVGSPAAYALVYSMSPDSVDSKEENNSFAKATAVGLNVPEAPHKIGVIREDTKIFEQLNFHDLQDIDYFDVAYVCPQYDDTEDANRPYSNGTNRVLGLTYAHQPPILSCNVTPAPYRCLDVAVYKWDEVHPMLYAYEAKSAGCSIKSPLKNLGRKRCYFVISNNDFASQGVFPYWLRFAYTSAYDIVQLDPHAPAYTQGNATIKRRILDKLYRRIDLPRPADHRLEVIQVDDVAAFIQKYEQFLVDGETADLFGQSLRTEGRAVVAEALDFLGQLAQTFVQVDDSERIYQKSANTFSEIGDKARAAAVLERLMGLYATVGKIDKLKGVNQQILGVRGQINIP